MLVSPRFATSFPFSAADSSVRTLVVPAFARRVDAPRRVLGHLEMLRMHLVLLDVFNLDRPERAEPHVQKHGNDVDSLFADSIQQFGREMQSRSRRCGGALMARVHGLIPLAILELLVNIRRQRHFAQRVQRRLKRALAFKFHDSAAHVGRFQHAPAQTAVAEYDLRARLQLFAGLDQRLPPLRRKLFQQKHLARAAGRTLAVEPRGNDARVVHHQHVAGIQIIDHVVKMPVLNFVGVAVNHHQPAVIARLDRRLRNALLRQIIHKIRKLHIDSSLFSK